jgi:signal transduction histidine kinase/FixJ family two-component response regulator
VHKLLARQLKRCFGSAESVPDALLPFIAAVDEAYRQAEADRLLLEHSMETVSQEMVERFRLLQEALAESQRAEAEVTGALSLLEATLESTTDGILVVDGAGKMVRMNQKFVDLWRIPEAILASQDDASALAFVVDQLEQPDEFLSKVRELYSQPEAESSDVLRFKDRRVFERYSKPQRVAGETVGRVWSFRDVTGRLQLEDQLRQSQKMEAIGSLAGGVAHDFNNLLMVITGHAEFLLEELGVSRTESPNVDEILQAASRAAELTHQLLAFSRKQILQPVVLDLNAVVVGLEPMLRRLIGEDIQTISVLSPDLSAVTADRGQMEQALVNLAVNARDAMPNGGRLIFETRNVRAGDESEPVRSGTLPAGEYVLLSVRDNGRGVPRDLQSRIFEPFFTTKAAGKGTGLGLATVYGIVQQSGGFISLDSESGAGATFRIYLPAARGTPETAEVHPRRRPVSAGTETILLAEDEGSVREFVRRILERQGYSVLCASCGREAIAVAAAAGRRIDLILTDVVMPHMGGRELVESLRQQHPDARVLYMSGYTNDEIVRGGVLQTDTSFLQKPFDGTELALAVRDALDRPMDAVRRPSSSETRGAAAGNGPASASGME